MKVLVCVLLLGVTAVLAQNGVCGDATCCLPNGCDSIDEDDAIGSCCAAGTVCCAADSSFDRDTPGLYFCCNPGANQKCTAGTGTSQSCQKQADPVVPFKYCNSDGYELSQQPPRECNSNDFNPCGNSLTMCDTEGKEGHQFVNPDSNGYCCSNPENTCESKRFCHQCTGSGCAWVYDDDKLQYGCVTACGQESDGQWCTHDSTDCKWPANEDKASTGSCWSRCGEIGSGSYDEVTDAEYQASRSLSSPMPESGRVCSCDAGCKDREREDSLAPDSCCYDYLFHCPAQAAN